jgi:hypothetical protein
MSTLCYVDDVTFSFPLAGSIGTLSGIGFCIGVIIMLVGMVFDGDEIIDCEMFGIGILTIVASIILFLFAATLELIVSLV